MVAYIKNELCLVTNSSALRRLYYLEACLNYVFAV